MMKVQIATKADKKHLKHFYKAEKYSASFMGFDDCYFIQDKNEIIASVIVSNIRENGELRLLHALVVKKAMHKHGLGSKLLNHIQSLYPAFTCFFSHDLVPFYNTNNVIFLTENEGKTKLPTYLFSRYKTYQQKQKTLKIGYWRK